MGIRYEDDVAAWADEQAALLRAGRLDAIDLAHIAEEIASVGRAERHALTSRMVVLAAHLLKWQCQPGRRGASWAGTIALQRAELQDLLAEAPSLRGLLTDPAWCAAVWRRARLRVQAETGLPMPDDWPWPVALALDAAFLPA